MYADRNLDYGVFKGVSSCVFGIENNNMPGKRYGV